MVIATSAARVPASETEPPFLDVRRLSVALAAGEKAVGIIDEVSLSVGRGETLALVGESGSGKSVTALAIMQLLPMPPARIVGGEIDFDGRDLLRVPPKEIRRLRGKEISMIFQEPLTSLHPAYTVGDQIIEVLRLHGFASQRQARAKALEMLRRVRIPDPERRIDEYPHRMSGGMRQRAMIAMALACNPRLLIADEPTTALDVTVQAQILELLRQMQAQYGVAIILITHDLNVVAEVAHQVAVMYAGRVVERASVVDLFDNPQHPYTIGLLAAAPTLGRTAGELPSIGGQVPDAANYPSGCRFHPRCPFAVEHCRHESPPLGEVKPRHWSACWRAPLEDLA
jgi:peptide/nickel transport system ATP-binding protein